MNTFLEIVLGNIVMATVLAVAAVAVGRLWRRPALTHGLWLMVLLKLITPPLITLPVLGFEPLEDSRRAAGISLPVQAESAIGEPLGEGPAGLRLPLAENEPEVIQLQQPAEIHEEVAAAPIPDQNPQEAEGPRSGEVNWLWLLGACWLTGTMVWFVLAGARILRFQRLLRYAYAPAEEIQQETCRLAVHLGLSHVPRVWLVPGVISPMVWGVGRSARLLIPTRLLERLTPEQRAALLTHELAHLRRGDHWVRLLEMTVLGLYWWCPLAWWACAELRDAEEECCDAWVVWALPGNARAYALALVETLDFLADGPASLPHLASGIGHVHFLKRRLTMIMKGTTPRALTVWGLLVLGGLGLVLLPMLPTSAQQPGIPKDLERELDRIRETQEKLERARGELDKQRAELERQAQEIRKNQERFKKQDNQQGQRGEQGQNVPKTPRPADAPKPPQPPQRPGDPNQPKPPFGKGGPPFAKGFQDMEHRLHDMEKKLESLMHDVQQLRRDLSQGPRGFGPPKDGGFSPPKRFDGKKDGKGPQPGGPGDRPGFFPGNNPIPKEGGRPPANPAGRDEKN